MVIDKLRFFIIDEKNKQRSSVWNVFAKNNSLYVCPQSTGGLLKLSFHPEGMDGKNSQIGIKNDYKLKIEAEGYSSPSPVRWTRPATPIEGISKVVSIFFPTNFLRGNIEDKKTPASKKKIKFAIPIAKSDEAVEVTIFYTLDKPKKVEKILTKNLLTLLGSFYFENNEKVFVTARHVKFDLKLFPSLDSAKINLLPGAPKNGESFNNLHAFLFGDPDKNQSICLAEANGLTVKNKGKILS